jgi:hypothetical protein
MNNSIFDDNKVLVEMWGTGCIGWEEYAFSGKQIPKAASPIFFTLSPKNK